MRIVPALATAGSALALCLAPGCHRNKAPRPAQAEAPLPKEGLRGTVREVIPTANYTYLNLDTAQGEIWASVPATEVKVGAQVTFRTQLRMDQFKSPSLNRVFPVLYMGTLEGAQPAPSAAPAPAPAAGEERVEKAPGAGARTVAELHARRGELKGRAVVVRGKVVKYNASILGKNWIHLRDGSGSPAAKDNDIAVTSQDAARVGEIITIKGTVHLDRDFGSGYTYPVIIEDAKIQK